MKKKLIAVSIVLMISLMSSQAVGIGFSLSGIFNHARNWDINVDGSGNFQDLGAVGLVYGSDPFDGREDVNSDDKVNFQDLGEVGLHYGDSY